MSDEPSADSPARRARRRLAVVLVVPRPVSLEIDGLRRALGAAERTRIPPHLTLVPTVNVREDDVASACELVRHAAAGVGPIAVELGPPATFLPANPVCYLEVSGAAGVMSTLRELADTLGRGPLAPPPSRRDRAYVPHVTINQRMAPASIESALGLLGSYRVSVVFERVTVLEHSAQERRWNALADFALSAPAVVGRGGFEVQLSVTERLDPGAESWWLAAWEQYSQAQYGQNPGIYRPFAITARVDGEIVGAAEGEIRGPVCHLARLLVSPARRSLGIGTKLLTATEQVGLESGCEGVRLETLTGGRAEAYYRGRGYVVAAVLPLWREDRDFVLMERGIRA